MTGEKVPLVSVVMPSYNHAAYIGSAVASVLAQTHSNLELIVVDNRSSDGTDAVLAAVGDPRLRVEKIDNGGIIAASRNLGIKKAAGEFVAFIDSDDVWLPGKLEAQLAAFSRAPAALLAYSRFRTLEGEKTGDEVLPPLAACAEGDIFERLYLKTFIACSGVLARRAALEALGGFSEDRELVAIEDMDLWLRMAAEHKAVCSSVEPLFLYRVHAGGMSAGWLRRYRRSLRLARRHAGRAGLPRFVMAAALGLVSAAKGALRG